MLRFIYKYCVFLAILWAVVIFILCSTPGQYIPSANWLELLSFDKWVHASVFFTLQFLCLTIVIKQKKPFYIALVFFAICVLYGGSLEVMQAKFFSNRSADILDFIANSFGCVIALLLYKRLIRLFSAAANNNS